MLNMSLRWIKREAFVECLYNGVEEGKALQREEILARETKNRHK